jgi:hypothetical protein
MDGIVKDEDDADEDDADLRGRGDDAEGTEKTLAPTPGNVQTPVPTEEIVVIETPVPTVGIVVIETPFPTEGIVVIETPFPTEGIVVVPSTPSDDYPPPVPKDDYYVPIPTPPVSDATGNSASYPSGDVSPPKEYVMVPPPSSDHDDERYRYESNPPPPPPSPAASKSESESADNHPPLVFLFDCCVVLLTATLIHPLCKVITPGHSLLPP